MSRFLTLKDKSALKDLRTEYSKLVFEAMHKESKSVFLFDKLNKNPDHVPVINEICKELLEDVEGEAEEKVKAVLNHPTIRKHYLSYLKSFSNRKKVKGLLYLKNIQSLPDNEEGEVFKLLNHRLHYLSHAGAMVILASPKKHLHEKTLIYSCKRSEDCKYTFVELLWEYWKNDSVSRQTKSECFQSLLGTEEISLDMKALLVRVISTFDEHHFSIYFHEILKFILRSDSDRRNYSFIAALINALEKSGYVNAEKEVLKSFSIKNKKIRIAAVKALVKFKTTTAIRELTEIYSNSKEYLKKEISFIIEHDEELSKKIIPSKAVVSFLKEHR